MARERMAVPQEGFIIKNIHEHSLFCLYPIEALREKA